ncbi:hypothetical protein CTEN210_04102 [Chaetoceros tenuissimus]|uniref:RING-type E3 ubiquitin transferase n=1 Tax=Chaetoceros tenuissimus TaxID=426638 RepID=A0AAD3H1Z1_9STRA|nr:hypothetical protein CTEN210_04102 [Chaetoceros tenuissimus]
MKIIISDKEWDEIKKLGPGVRIYRGKKTLFYNGERLYSYGYGRTKVYDEKERESWEMIIVLPGVTSIPSYSFYACRFLEAVIMPDSVRTINRYVFTLCVSLKFIRLSRRLKCIKDYAFDTCGLTAIFIPKSCKMIGDKAFFNCNELHIVNVSEKTKLGNYAIPVRVPVSYSGSDIKPENEGYQLIKNVDIPQQLNIHKICSSENVFETINGISLKVIVDQWTNMMNIPNQLGITPTQYLLENPYTEIDGIESLIAFKEKSTSDVERLISIKTENENLYAENLRLREQLEEHEQIKKRDKAIENFIAELKQDLECPICIEPFNNAHMVPECGHHFCKKCIEAALQNCNNECPICRSKITSKRGLRQGKLISRITEVFFPDEA